jgi:hypothetical protein
LGTPRAGLNGGKKFHKFRDKRDSAINANGRGMPVWHKRNFKPIGHKKIL